MGFTDESPESVFKVFTVIKVQCLKVTFVHWIKTTGRIHAQSEKRLLEDKRCLFYPLQVKQVVFMYILIHREGDQRL